MWANMIMALARVRQIGFFVLRFYFNDSGLKNGKAIGSFWLYNPRYFCLFFCGLNYQNFHSEF